MLTKYGRYLTCIDVIYTTMLYFDYPCFANSVPILQIGKTEAGRKWLAQGHLVSA